jgi:hypothetical protein
VPFGNALTGGLLRCELADEVARIILPLGTVNHAATQSKEYTQHGTWVNIPSPREHWEHILATACPEQVSGHYGHSDNKSHLRMQRIGPGPAPMLDTSQEQPRYPGCSMMAVPWGLQVMSYSFCLSVDARLSKDQLV